MQQEAEPRYGEKLRNCGMPSECARLTWRCFLADSSDVKPILTLKEQNFLTKPANFIASAVMADVVVPLWRLPSSAAMFSDTEDWTIVKLVVVEKEKRVGGKHCHCSLGESCHVESRKVPKSVSEMGGLTFALVKVAVIASLRRVGKIGVSRTD